MEDPLDKYDRNDRKQRAELNRQLAKNQRKSSATETLFTFAILFFSYVQLKGYSIFEKPSGIVVGKINTLPVDIVFFGVLIIAAMIGWRSVYIETVLSYQDLKDRINNYLDEN